MGFGLLFRISEKDIEKHKNERRIKCDISSL